MSNKRNKNFKFSKPFNYSSLPPTANLNPINNRYFCTIFDSSRVSKRIHQLGSKPPIRKQTKADNKNSVAKQKPGGNV